MSETAAWSPRRSCFTVRDMPASIIGMARKPRDQPKPARTEKCPGCGADARPSTGSPPHSPQCKWK